MSENEKIAQIKNEVGKRFCSGFGDDIRFLLEAFNAKDSKIKALEEERNEAILGYKRVTTLGAEMAEKMARLEQELSTVTQERDTELKRARNAENELHEWRINGINSELRKSLEAQVAALSSTLAVSQKAIRELLNVVKRNRSENGLCVGDIERYDALATPAEEQKSDTFNLHGQEYCNLHRIDVGEGRTQSWKKSKCPECLKPSKPEEKL